MDIEQLIEILQELRAGSVALDCSAGIFDHKERPGLDDHLGNYDGWMVSTLRIVTPPGDK